MCWGDDASVEMLRGGVRRSRKDRRCDEGCRIGVGDQYHYWVGLYDGEFSTSQTCLACLTASAVLGAACRLYDPDSVDAPIGELLAEFNEHLDGGELAANGVPDDVIAKCEIQRQALLERVGQ